MSDKDPSLRRNAPKLALHVPEPPFRPGDTPDFSLLEIPAAGSAPRPDTSVPAAETHPLTTALVRVLGERPSSRSGRGTRSLIPTRLRKMLRDMITVRIFDDRMYRAQRQGKTSFYMKCDRRGGDRRRGPDRARRDDMHFPTYRQQGLLDRARLSTRRHDVPDLFESRRQAEGPPTADHVFRQGPRLLFDLRQSRDAISAGGRLGDGRARSRATAALPWAGPAKAQRQRAISTRADLRRRLQCAGRSWRS